MNIFKNEKQFPKVYFARHIKEGLVSYREKDSSLHTYLIKNEALQKMNPSFAGKPVYVRHVDEVNLDTLRNDADGYVIKSFYNEFDGAWWSEILIVSDKGHSAVEKGWAVSNCYSPTEYGSGGEYHATPFEKEILNGTYEHLAIVDNPRYEEACIMTPEEYKSYTEGKKQEILKLKNSKEKEEMFSEEDKKALTDELVKSLMPALKNAIDEKFEEAKKNAAEEDHRRLIREIAAVSAKAEGDFEGGMEEKVRTIIGLAEKLGYSKDEAGKNAKQNECETKATNPAPKGDEDAEYDRKDLKPAASQDEEKKKDKKTNSKGWFSILKNAKDNSEVPTVSTSASGVARGKALYGSK